MYFMRMIQNAQRSRKTGKKRTTPKRKVWLSSTSQLDETFELIMSDNASRSEETGTFMMRSGLRGTAVFARRSEHCT